MTKNEYKEAIRKYRGHLKSVDKELEEIFDYGTMKFIEYTLHTKQMGVRKLAFAAKNVSNADLDELVDWLLEGVRTKAQIDLKLLELV
jgi:hypothetical protein